WRKKRKKTRKHQAKPEKRVRIVFRALHNYARKRCAIGFVRSEHRTAQNDKFSPLVRGALTGFPVWGSKRESQKIPSFRMMKIQSTPRLT
ncbi:hypothetical protein ACQLNG_005186, partial [Escherichia coli]